MQLTNEQVDAVVAELKRIGGDLNLTDEQKRKLQAFMTEASERVQEYKQQNPNATRGEIAQRVLDNRAALRQRLVNFLTSEQLAKWDAEIAKAKEFLGHKVAA